MHAYRNPSISASNRGPTAPAHLPLHVYRVHRPSAQTRYSFGTGFRSKNQTTIVNLLSILNNFGLAHLTAATNISSPLISVYDDPLHAERMAHYISRCYGEETWVVKVDTRHLARGPVFRAANLLEESWREKEEKGEVVTEAERELHRGGVSDHV